MYKLLLAEDEVILREGVSEEIADMGYFSVDTASNGEEAFEMAQKNDYDAIILDIKMPKMDGMQLLKKLHEIQNDSIKIIMSGFADFNYAKKGIEYGVSDYVVKPLDPERIRQMGEKLFDMVDRRQREREQVEVLKEKLMDAKPIRTDMIFCRMVNNEYTGAETEKKLKAEGVFFDEKPLRVLLIYPVREDERPEADRFTFKITADTAALVFTEEETQIEQFAKKYCSRYPKRALICAISNEQNGAERLKEAYVSAEEALAYAQLLEKKGVIHYNEVKSTGCNIFVDELKFRMQLCLAKDKELKEWIDQMFNEFPVAARSQDFYSFAIYIAMLCQNNVRKLSAEKANMIIDYKAVLRMKTLTEFKTWTNEVIETACILMSDNTRKRSILEVEKTKAYIDEHLSEYITMSDLAKHAYLSSNYLGKIFQETLGMSVSEYINTSRIERACELIRSGNTRLYEIAGMIGIRDPNYFSSLFKKIVGITPKEYKSLVGAQERTKKV